MHVLLISTYELGRQPFGLASPAAWLREAGASVTCLDLALQRLDEAVVRDAELVAFYLPMHTATRIAARAMKRVRALNPRAHQCCYGLYAPLNEGYLRALGARTILGGEFEAGLVSLVRRLHARPSGRACSRSRSRGSRSPSRRSGSRIGPAFRPSPPTPPSRWGMAAVGSPVTRR